MAKRLSTEELRYAAICAITKLSDEEIESLFKEMGIRFCFSEPASSYPEADNLN